MNNSHEEISKYIKSGANNNQFLGLEIEHFILDQHDKSVYYSYENDKAGVVDILEELSEFYDEKVYESFGSAKHLIGLKRKDTEISIEPGAQFEASFCPVENVEDIEKLYANFLNETNWVLSRHNYHLENISYRPDACALEVPLIPKMRYAYMDANFRTVDSLGICMMRCSCASQITIDFKNEQDCIKKAKVGNAIAPLLYFLYDNCSVFERTKINNSESVSISGLPVPKRMARFNIWNHADSDACGSIPHIFDENFNIDDYAKTINKLPKIYNPNNFDTKEQSIEHDLSMCFYDVRIKKSIEIRAVDSMPIEYILSYAALVKALFYNQQNLYKLYCKFKNISLDDYKQACENLVQEGWNAKVYNKAVDELLIEILDIADAKNNKYLSPCLELVNKKLCLKDYLNHNFKIDDRKFSHESKTEINTKFQTDIFNSENLAADRENFYNIHKQSKGTSAGKITKCSYFCKAFDLYNIKEFESIIFRTTSILNKVIDEYYNNTEYAKLFKFDKFSQRLINFRPKYLCNIPIARYDIFFDDKTGNFQFCEFNTGGTAGMCRAQFIADEIKKTELHKKLSENLAKQNIKLKTWELFNTWVCEFLKIYKQWAENTNYNKTKPNVAIVDFLDNCQYGDFEPFKEAFENNQCNCEICDIRNLKFDGQNLTDNKGNKFDAIYKRVTLNDLKNFQGDAGVNAMIDAVLANKVCPIDWFSNQIVHDKQIFYVLFHPMTKKLLSSSEITFVEKSFPKTYLLENNCKMLDTIIENKNEYIIKPLNGRFSIDVFSGQDYSSNEWNKIVENCAEKGNFIAQEFCKIYTSNNVEIDAYDKCGSLTNSIKQFSNMLGLYCYNNKFSGVFLRQGDHSKGSTKFDLTCTCFYEDYN